MRAAAARSCDVLVVGGGPAGSTCAHQLLRAGLDVLVMDTQAFPRDKVCAGWITPAVVESLELDLDEYATGDGTTGRTLQPIRGFRIGTIGGREVETRYEGPVSYGIRRREFDHYLLRRSLAPLAAGTPARNFVRERKAWLIDGKIRAAMIVGAGGNFCPVARMLGSEPGGVRATVVAQETEFALPGPVPAPAPNGGGGRPIEDGVAQIYFCPDLKGYGWCIAKNGYLNVGLGREDVRGLPHQVELFRRWLRERGGMPQELPDRFDGHAYQLYPESRRRLFDAGVLLVGDSAGLAYPRSGEGIRPAVESALLAAEVIRAADGNYSRENLAHYAGGLAQRFGARTPGREAAAWLPAGLKRALAAKLLASAWFTRHIVIDRWFLHAAQRPFLPKHT